MEYELQKDLDPFVNKIFDLFIEYYKFQFSF